MSPVSQCHQDDITNFKPVTCRSGPRSVLVFISGDPIARSLEQTPTIREEDHNGMIDSHGSHLHLCVKKREAVQTERPDGPRAII